MTLPAAPTDLDTRIATLVAALADALRAVGAQMATAESCTGGLIAGACTELAGSSDWFDRGFVTYSNAAKHDMLGVPPALIAAHGAVSEEVAHAMALGALQHSSARFTVAVTGIAGPTGGSPDKPVGTVCFGWACRAPDGTASCTTERRRFHGDRASVRRQTVAHALAGVLGTV